MSMPRLSIIPAGAVTDARLTAVDIRVLALFGRHTDDAGWCRRSQVKMARELDVGRATVYRAIERLCDAGWLQKRNPDAVHQPGIRDSAFEYRVRLDVDDEANPEPEDAPPVSPVGTPPVSPVGRGCPPEWAPMLTTPTKRSISLARSRDPREVLLEVVDEASADALVAHFEGLGKPLDGYVAELKAKQLAKADDPKAAARVLISKGWVNLEPHWLRSHRRAGENGRGGKGKAKPETPARLLARIAREQERDEAPGAVLAAPAVVFVPQSSSAWRWLCEDVNHPPGLTDKRGGWTFPAEALEQWQRVHGGG